MLFACVRHVYPIDYVLTQLVGIGCCVGKVSLSLGTVFLVASLIAILCWTVWVSYAYDAFAVSV
jgi:hypothetical protein